jgi:hypothetical protein
LELQISGAVAPAICSTAQVQTHGILSHRHAHANLTSCQNFMQQVIGGLDGLMKGVRCANRNSVHCSHTGRRLMKLRPPKSAVYLLCMAPLESFESVTQTTMPPWHNCAKVSSSTVRTATSSNAVLKNCAGVQMPSAVPPGIGRITVCVRASLHSRPRTSQSDPAQIFWVR